MMEPELSASDRVKLLLKRIASLKAATGLSVESRLRALRDAEKTLASAERDLAAFNRQQDKTSRAVKPIPNESDVAAKKWLRGMENEKRVK